ncbi:MAG: hypothetical protein H0V44_17300 [Planctomycetes bacterium]|nr:hypothetical protein [Planctomycetota bacterium]
MQITIHGHLVPIPASLAQYARHRLSQALGKHAHHISRVTLRLVQTVQNRIPHWVCVLDLGRSGTVIVRSTIDERLAACAEIADRAAASVAHRLYRPAAPSGRVHSTIQPPQHVRTIT